MLAPCFLYYGGIYSENCGSLDDLKENGVGGTFVIAQDASDQSLDLLALQDAGLITLTDEDKPIFTVLLISWTTPMRLSFFIWMITLSIAPRDEFAAYTGSSNTMATFGIDPSENQLYYVDHSSEALGVCVNAEDADTQVGSGFSHCLYL